MHLSQICAPLAAAPFEEPKPSRAEPTDVDNPSGVVIYEMGSSSLKRHSIQWAKVSGARVTTTKHAWNVSHRFYGQGAGAAELAGEVVTCLRELRDQDDCPERGLPGFVLATGVFRDISDIPLLSNRVYAETALPMKVMRGVDEARLIASAARKAKLAAPALITDLGGSTLEYAELADGSKGRFGSIALGAIRNHHRFSAVAHDTEQYLRHSAAYCDDQLGEVPQTEFLYAAGGTAKALAKIVGHECVTVHDLRHLIARLLHDGPPPGLAPRRARVLLPGAVILWRLVRHCGANAFHYQGVSLRDGMLWRLARAIMKGAATDVHASRILTPTTGSH
jgi:exopolyphosphatase/pppGpp-phosphohydrolase